MCGRPSAEPTNLSWRRLGRGGLLAAVVGLAFWLRIGQVSESLWLDELHTAWVVADGAEQLVPRAAAGNHSPAYFALVWAATRWAGSSELSLRLASILAGTALVAGVCFAVTRWTACWSAGLLAALLVAVDRHCVFYVAGSPPLCAGAIGRPAARGCLRLPAPADAPRFAFDLDRDRRVVVLSALHGGFVVRGRSCLLRLVVRLVKIPSLRCGLSLDATGDRRHGGGAWPVACGAPLARNCPAAARLELVCPGALDMARLGDRRRVSAARLSPGTAGYPGGGLVFNAALSPPARCSGVPRHLRPALVPARAVLVPRPADDCLGRHRARATRRCSSAAI